MPHSSQLSTHQHLSLPQIHLAANYAAMKVLALRSINRSRLEVLLSDYEAHGPSEPSRYTPSVIGRQESVLPWLAALNPLNLFRARRAKVSASSSPRCNEGACH